MRLRTDVVLAVATLVAALATSTSPAVAQVSHPYPGMTLVEHSGPIALVVMDLCAPGADVRATRYDEREATPRQWAEPRGIHAAINADFFDFPGWSWVIGRARGAGADWPAGSQNREAGRPYWEFTGDGAHLVDVGATQPAAGAREIVGGHNIIIAHGRSTGPWSLANDGSLLNNSYRRSAIGLSADRRFLYFFSSNVSMSAQSVVDRMQAYAREAGAPVVDYATNQDGGGSSQLYVRGRGQIVDSGRLVNNHLGIFARGPGAAPFCPNHAPRGALDGATCTAIRGWAQDVDTAASPIDVHLFIDGAPGTAGATRLIVRADDPRSDLCSVLGSCNHAFTTPLPTAFFDNRIHSVRAYGIDDAHAINPQLANSPRNVRCTALVPPLDAAHGVRRHVTSGAVLSAWRFDRLEIAPVSDALLNTYEDGPDLAAGPSLIHASSGSIDLLEFGTIRHVTNPTSLVAWHLENRAIATPSAAQLAADLHGASLPARPFLAQGSGAAVYLIDSPPPLWADVESSDPPSSLRYNESRTITFRVRNRGSMVWRVGDVFIAPTAPRNHASAFCNSDAWPSCRRAATLEHDTAPGNVATFVVHVRAPMPSSATSVRECWGFVANSTHWFSDRGQMGPSDDALCQRIALVNPPVAFDGGTPLPVDAGTTTAPDASDDASTDDDASEQPPAIDDDASAGADAEDDLAYVDDAPSEDDASEADGGGSGVREDGRDGGSGRLAGGCSASRSLRPRDRDRASIAVLLLVGACVVRRKRRAVSR